SAALYGSLAVGMLREQADRTGMRPAEVLANMNTKLHQLEIDNRFVAMLFASYDGAKRTLTLANSGLPRPYLLRDWSVHQIDVVGYRWDCFQIGPIRRRPSSFNRGT
ncbi:MAG: SpoIIE family protein phosphatase, partial [Thermoanaerobaculia bacterium]